MSIQHSPHQSIGRFHGTMLLLLIMLASMLRIYGIDRESLWTDELFAVMASYLPTFSDLWPILINDSHPPGYVALMYWILPLSGYSDFGVRLHALLFGIIWIPLVYWLGKRLYSMHVGIVAAAIITCSFSAIYFSQEARAYSMLVTFNLLNIVCFFEILFAKQIERRYIVGFILSSIILYYLHYTGFVFIAAEGLLYIILHIAGWRRGTWRELLVIFGIPLLVYSPWLWFMFDHVTDQSKNWAVSAKPTPMDVFYTFRYLWGPDHNHTLLFIYSMPIAFAISMREYLRKKPENRMAATCVLLFLMIVPVLAFYIESVFWTPIFEKRYFLVTVPIVAILAAMVLVKAIETLTTPVWHKPLIATAIVLICIAMISKNIERKLYSAENKDPVRQAVDIIKADLGDNIHNNNYTTLITHNSFEHYLKRAGVKYDSSWRYRRYYVPAHVSEIKNYLSSHPEIDYFYYIAAKEMSSDRAKNALKLKYKRLAKIQIPFNGGQIDAVKYSAKEPATPEQIAEVRNSDTSPLNNAIESVAIETQGKTPGSYVVLYTHEFIADRLPVFNLQVDSSLRASQYVSDLQIAEITHYIKNHPPVDTIYYFALRQPESVNARLMLKATYQMVSEESFEITAGTLDIIKLNARIKPTLDKKTLASLQANNPFTSAMELVAKDAKNRKPGSYAILFTHDWMEDQLPLYKLPIDNSFLARKYTSDLQITEITNYIKANPSIDTLYYFFMREPDKISARNILKAQYQVLFENSINYSGTPVDIFGFNTKKPAVITDTLKQDFSGNKIYQAAAQTARYALKKSAGKSVIVVSHAWFKPYLELNNIHSEESLNSGFLSFAAQAPAVTSYLNSHADVKNVYYLALQGADADGAITAVKNNLVLSCQTAINAAPLGNIMISRFNRGSGMASPNPVPTCTE